MTLQLPPKTCQMITDTTANSDATLDSTVEIFIDRKIATGNFPVYHAYLPFEAAEYALKIFPKNKQSHDSYAREKEIISKLSHKYIIKYASKIHLKNIKDFDSDEYILMEYAPYGNFYELVVNKCLIDDKLMRTYFHQLISGVEYLHSQNIAHVDLKLQNLLLGEDFKLKICDFDQSQYVGEEKFKGRGTPCYRSPQMLEGKCEDLFAADVYSIGIMLYICKAREFPFVEHREGGRTKLLHYDLFCDNNEEFWRVKVAERSNSEFFSQDFQALVNGMLENNPEKRFTLEDIKRSRWYNGPVFEEEELKKRMERMWERITFKKSLRKGSQDVPS